MTRKSKFLIFFSLFALILVSYLVFIDVLDGDYYNKGKSKNWQDGSFKNIVDLRKPSVVDLLKWKIEGKPNNWPDWIETKYLYPLVKIPENSVRITYVNHSTFLIYFRGVNILTDPVWSDKVGPTSYLGLKRVRDPGVRFEDLPKIDLVLVSHSHFDHLDIPTLKKLKEKFNPLFISGLGNCEGIIKSQIDSANCMEFDWFEGFKFGNIDVNYTPAHHWSSRGLRDRDTALWGSFVFGDDKSKIFFAGDTAFAEGVHIKMIKEKFPDINVALLPIGSYLPRSIMKNNHTSPDEAVEIFKILEPDLAIAMHHKTFNLGNDAYNQPSEDLKKSLEKKSIKRSKFIDLEFGHSIFYLDRFSG